MKPHQSSVVLSQRVLFQRNQLTYSLRELFGSTISNNPTIKATFPRGYTLDKSPRMALARLVHRPIGSKPQCMIRRRNAVERLANACLSAGDTLAAAVGIAMIWKWYSDPPVDAEEYRNRIRELLTPEREARIMHLRRSSLNLEQLNSGEMQPPIVPPTADEEFVDRILSSDKLLLAHRAFVQTARSQDALNEADNLRFYTDFASLRSD